MLTTPRHCTWVSERIGVKEIGYVLEAQSKPQNTPSRKGGRGGQNDLIHTMTFLTHLKESFPGLWPNGIPSLQLDQFYGGRSAEQEQPHANATAAIKKNGDDIGYCDGLTAVFNDK